MEVIRTFPTPLDYAARRSPWSWRSQLTIWFQLVKIWVTTFPLLSFGDFTYPTPLGRRSAPLETSDRSRLLACLVDPARLAAVNSRVHAAPPLAMRVDPPENRLCHPRT